MHVNLQGHKSIDMNATQTSYEYDLEYTLVLIPAPDKFENKLLMFIIYPESLTYYYDTSVLST